MSERSGATKNRFEIAVVCIALVASVAMRARAQDGDTLSAYGDTPAETSPSAAPGTLAEETETHCVRGDDASEPHLDVSAGGGYGAYAVTWVQASDIQNLPSLPSGRPSDGVYQGGLFRGELALRLALFRASVGYTHFFGRHDDGTQHEFGFLTGGLGLQCACLGNPYIWSFHMEGGWDVLNRSVVVGARHRSQLSIVEGLFVALDLGVSLLVGVTTGGASGGGFEGALLLGYSLG